MIFMRLLPGALKELSKHVPAILFEVVEWSDLAAELPKLSRRLVQKEEYDRLFDAQKTFLAPLGIELTHTSLPAAPKVLEKWTAEHILRLYFSQLYSPHGMFIDLRSNSFKPSEPTLLWHPSNLFTRLHDDFRLGLIDVYSGFYLEDDELFYQGLLQTGFISTDWSAEDKKSLGDLFKSHFGSSLTNEMHFNLEEFKVSIFKTSNFLMKKKVKITKDFLYLGIYLVTLYSSLEQCPEKLPVKKIFEGVRNHFANQS